MLSRMIAIPSRGVSFYVREEGHGFPILMMHGGPGADHSTLLPLLPLAEKRRLIFYDHRCNGRSTKADLKTFNWENLAADADAIRQSLGIQKWAVVGHSFGGMVAIEYAIRYPHQITHLILLDSASDGSWVYQKASQELQKQGFSRLVVEIAGRFYQGRIARREFVKCMIILARAYYSHPTAGFVLKEALHAMKIRANPQVCIYASRELLSRWSATERLSQIQADVLIIAGVDDFLCPPEHQKEMQKCIKGAELHLLSGAGHNAHMEQPGKVLDIVDAFLANG